MSTQRLGCPDPEKQLLQPADRRVGNVGENVGEPCLWVDIIELGSHDQRCHERGTIGTSIRSGEEPDDMTVLGGGSDPSQDVLAPEGR